MYQRKYKKINYSVNRIIGGNATNKDNLEMTFDNGIHSIDIRRQATKYFFELLAKTKKEYYGSLWEVSLSVFLWTEDHDLDFHFDRRDKYELFTVKSNKLDYIVNWGNLKLEREAAVDKEVYYDEFNISETNITNSTNKKIANRRLKNECWN